MKDIEWFKQYLFNYNNSILMRLKDVTIEEPSISISKHRMRVLIVNNYSKQFSVHSISNYLSKVFTDGEQDLTKQHFYKVAMYSVAAH